MKRMWSKDELGGKNDGSIEYNGEKYLPYYVKICFFSWDDPGSTENYVYYTLKNQIIYLKNIKEIQSEGGDDFKLSNLLSHSLNKNLVFYVEAKEQSVIIKTGGMADTNQDVMYAFAGQMPQGFENADPASFSVIECDICDLEGNTILSY